MSKVFLISIFLLAGAALSHAEIATETPSKEILGQPSDNWFLNRNKNGAYLFDSVNGDMLGTLSLTEYTPAVAVSRSRKEIYAAESYFSRLYRGDREDVLTVYDIATLAPIAEIDIPDKFLEVIGESNIGLMDNDKYLVLYNFSPAQSVSIVDLENRKFISEISTPGCGMVMPVENASFLMICGDGSLQLVQLADDGTEQSRSRSDIFFSVENDAVFDRAARTSAGWLLISHAGLAYDVAVKDATISIGEPWPLVSVDEREEAWRPGGSGLISVDIKKDLAFVLMHQGKVDTHHKPGTELWIFDTQKHRRVKRWVLDKPADNILVLAGEKSRLVMSTPDGKIRIYDALQQRFEREIAEPGDGIWLLQRF